MFTHGHDISESLLKTVREQHELISEYKIGDVVIPSEGPHAGIKHKVVGINEKRRITIAPMGLMGGENKYRYGVAVAKHDQVDRPEDLKEGVVAEARKYHGGYTSYSHKEVLQKVRDGEWEAHQDVEPNKLIDVTPHGKKRKMIHIHEDINEGVDQRKHGLTKINGTSKTHHVADAEWGDKDIIKKKSWSAERKTAEVNKVRKIEESTGRAYVQKYFKDGEHAGYKASNGKRLKFFNHHGLEAAKKHAGVTTIDESVDQIDELSTSTLTSYKKKAVQASNNMLDKDRKMKDTSDSSERKFYNRNAGVSRASDKLAESFKNWNVEFEPGDRAKVISGDHVGKRGTVLTKHDNGAIYEIKHTDGTVMKHHVSTLSEGIVMEISKATLGRYVKAAGEDMRKNMGSAVHYNRNADEDKKKGDQEGADWHRREARKHGVKVVKRQDGISKAVDKLTTEETDEEARKSIDKKIRASGKEWEKKHGMKLGKGSMMDPPSPKK